MSNVVTSERIPNNVGLSEDKKLQRALEAWQPSFINWWKEMGPVGFQQDDVFLRTAISVEPDGWANFDYVKMPDYRWGIFLADAVPDRTIGFGDCYGAPRLASMSPGNTSSGCTARNASALRRYSSPARSAAASFDLTLPER